RRSAPRRPRRRRPSFRSSAHIVSEIIRLGGGEMKKVLALCAAAALALCAAASAITNGVPDGNGHPEVGALLAQQAFSDGTWEECTGTLIAPHVFLTAEHCDEGVQRVHVTFASTYVHGTS